MYLELQTKKYGIVKYQISEQDLDLVKGLTLYISYVKATNSMYLMTKDRKYLHRVLMQPKKGEYIDHINHDTLDNRRENLKIVTPSENKRNTLKAYTDTQKLSQEDVKNILQSKESNNTLAKKYNVSNCLISKVRTGEMYKDYCSDIPRKENKGRAKRMSDEKRKIIKEMILNCTSSLYALAKIVNMPCNKLYQIRNGKIWKDI